ncbi:hypothetical protein OIV83_000070 [Microbotryomycetes sp. JL201]|nr:hypothetical protein OIV83_000070 [Microbotryomycetes sp. JL201]
MQPVIGSDGLSASGLLSAASLSPTSLEDELARKCRMLARSVGSEAVHEQQLHRADEHSPRSLPNSGHSSPARTSPRLAAGPGLSPLSPTHKFHHLPPPSPRSSAAYLPADGAFALAGISEEDATASSTAAVGSDAPTSFVLAHQDTHDDEDDEVSDIDSYMGDRRRLSSHTTLGSLQLMHNEGKWGRLYVSQALLKSSLQDGVSHFVIDLWLDDGELLVGHNQDSLSPERTLSSMYIDPLVSLLSQPSPPSSSFTFAPHHRRRSSAAIGSVQAKYLTRPLLLLVNLKTDPVTTLPFLLHYLTPLLDHSLLTKYCPNSAQTEQGLVTVACTDGTDVLKDQVANLTPRYVFLSALLDEEDTNWNKDVCTFVTADLDQVLCRPMDTETKGLSREEEATVISLVARVHEKGAKLRIGGLEGNEALSQQLTQLGVDYC